MSDYKEHTPNYTTKQHFIPQCILKNFTKERVKKGHLYQYNKQKGQINERHTNEIAFVKHLYSVETETTRDDSLEKKFSKFESETAPIIEKVIKQRSLETLTGDETQLLALFLISLYIRSAQGVELAKKTMPEALDKTINDINKQFPEWTEQTKEFIRQFDDKGRFFAAFFGSDLNRMFFNIITNMGMVLCAAPKNDYFILSDRYASESLKPVLNLDSGQSYIDNINAIIFPISSDLCIVFREKKIPAQKLLVRKHIQHLSPINLRQINRLTYRWAKKYLYCENAATLQFFRKLHHLNALKCGTALYYFI